MLHRYALFLPLMHPSDMGMADNPVRMDYPGIRSDRFRPVLCASLLFLGGPGVFSQIPSDPATDFANFVKYEIKLRKSLLGKIQAKSAKTVINNKLLISDLIDGDVSAISVRNSR